MSELGVHRMVRASARKRQSEPGSLIANVLDRNRRGKLRVAGGIETRSRGERGERGGNAED